MRERRYDPPRLLPIPFTQEMIRRVDVDGNLCLSFDEWCKVIIPASWSDALESNWNKILAVKAEMALPEHIGHVGENSVCVLFALDAGTRASAPDLTFTT